MRSFINPVLSNNRGASPESFSAFMTGRTSSIGSSVLNSAKNNIVNFNRASVRPVSTNIPDVINTISTNVNSSTNSNIVNTVVNNFKTQGQNIFKGFQNQFKDTLDALINSIKKDYQLRIQNLENNRPNAVLKKFLGLYQNAIDFISFFSNEKNVKRIQVALKTLRRIFDESFNVAIIIRKAINRIVRQLSNLPTASGNAPDLNLDIKVPEGKTSQSRRGGIGRFASSRAGQVAAVGLGLGAIGVGSQIASGMSKAEQIQEEKLKSTVKGQEAQQVVPDELLSGLERVINIFSNSIDELIEFAKKKPKSTTGTTSGSPASPPPEDGLNTPGGAGETANIGEMLASGATASWYDAYLGGINTSGHKTKEGLPKTSTGEPYIRTEYTAAAFPNLIRRLPESMTAPSSKMPGGRTVSKPFHVAVRDPKSGKILIVKVNDVGSGAPGQPASRLLDFSVATRNYFGGTEGPFEIYMLGPNSKAGPITQEEFSKLVKPTSQTTPAPIPRPNNSNGVGISSTINTQNTQQNGITPVQNTTGSNIEPNPSTGTGSPSTIPPNGIISAIPPPSSRIAILPISSNTGGGEQTQAPIPTPTDRGDGTPSFAYLPPSDGGFRHWAHILGIAQSSQFV